MFSPNEGNSDQNNSEYGHFVRSVCDDNKIPIKSLNDQIDFLKIEIKSKNSIITMILGNHKNEVGQLKPFGS